MNTGETPSATPAQQKKQAPSGMKLEDFTLASITITSPTPNVGDGCVSVDSVAQLDVSGTFDPGDQCASGNLTIVLSLLDDGGSTRVAIAVVAAAHVPGPIQPVQNWNGSLFFSEANPATPTADCGGALVACLECDGVPIASTSIPVTIV